jgi:hypothetical protein
MIIIEYQQLHDDHAEMEKHKATETGPDDLFWELHGIFRETLKRALADGLFLASLEKQELLTFIGWCSSYRPREPHTILSTLGQLGD